MRTQISENSERKNFSFRPLRFRYLCDHDSSQAMMGVVQVQHRNDEITL